MPTPQTRWYVSRWLPVCMRLRVECVSQLCMGKHGAALSRWLPRNCAAGLALRCELAGCSQLARGVCLPVRCLLPCCVCVLAMLVAS